MVRAHEPKPDHGARWPNEPANRQVLRACTPADRDCCRGADAGRGDRGSRGSWWGSPACGRSATRSTADQLRCARRSWSAPGWCGESESSRSSCRRRSGSRSCGWSPPSHAAPRCVSWVGGASPTPGAAFVACALDLRLVDRRRRVRAALRAGIGVRRRAALPAAPAGRVPAAGGRRRRCCGWPRCSPRHCCWRAEQWVIGGVAAVVAVALTWLLLPRFNALSRRWLVLVPAGVVVHDQVVLAETLMVSRSDVVGIELALAGTEAADFTGPAAGHAVEVSVRRWSRRCWRRPRPRHAARHCTCGRSSSPRAAPGAVLPPLGRR